VLATNAMNLIDGMDGVAGSITFLAALAFSAVGAWPIVAVVVAGATLGFLRHNLPPASVLLGDSGSLFLGFTLGALALLCPAYANLPLVAGILGYALGDVALAVLRRFIRGKPLFVGDRSHVHHKLLDTFGYVPAALLAAAAFGAIQVAIAIAYPGVISLSAQVFLWIAMATLLMAAGQVNVGRMLESRAPFRRLHLVRAYVMGLLRLSTSRGDVERGLQRLLQDLDLASIHLGDIEIRNGPRDRDLREVPVALRTQSAGWSYAPGPEELTLDRERQTVVLELLREAEHRLDLLGGRQAGRAGDTNPNNGRAANAVLEEPPPADVPRPHLVSRGPNGAAAPRR
jgi:UDP-GlcNAc:undecaprenyl-phosphate GlcNAc-1-phosphate transferase